MFINITINIKITIKKDTNTYILEMVLKYFIPPSQTKMTFSTKFTPFIIAWG